MNDLSKKDAASDAGTIESRKKEPPSKTVHSREHSTTCRSYQQGNVFDETKSRLTMAQVAREYGYTPNRGGFICCPFHKEKTASLKLYDRSFHCYGCGAGGSVIDFVAMLFQLDALGAVKRLNEDFSLGLDLAGRPDPDELRERKRTQEARKLFDEWREQTLNMLDACIRTANLADFDNLTDAAALALKWKSTFEYWADCLLHGHLDNQISIFDDRREVERLCKKILGNMSEKSKVA